MMARPGSWRHEAGMEMDAPCSSQQNSALEFRCDATAEHPSKSLLTFSERTAGCGGEGEVDVQLQRSRLRMCVLHLVQSQSTLSKCYLIAYIKLSYPTTI